VELLELEPSVKGRLVSAWLEELCEEVARREDPRHAHAVVELLKNIEQDWSSER
jgi:hypothetical protein